MTLYEIDAAIEEALSHTEVDEETGEIISSPNFEAVEKLAMEREKKLESVVLFIKNAKSDSEALAKEIKTQQARKRTLDNKIENAKTWIAGILQATGESVNTPRAKTTWRPSKETVIDDIHQIPELFLKYAEPTADKAAIKKAIEKEGLEIPGAHIETKQNLLIM